MDKDEKRQKKETEKLVEIICRTDKRCQERDCTKCDYSQYGERCYPMMLARAMRCSGVQLKADRANGRRQSEVSQAEKSGGSR